jgi:hypothetical protein
MGELTVTYTGSISLTPFASKRVFQRDVSSGDPAGAWGSAYGRGWATIDLTVSPTVGFQVLEYRVRYASLPADDPLLDWTACSGAQPAGQIAISAILPAAAAWFLIDVRADGDDSSVETTNPIGVGEIIAASGQSLATDFWTNSNTGDTNTLAACGVAPTAYGVCFASWDGAAPPASDAAWSVPADASVYKSTFCAEFLRLAVLGAGVVCALIGYAWSGEPIASWRADGSGPKDAWTPLKTTLDNAVGEGGKIGTFIWMHGHNDARIPQAGVDGDELTADKYLAALSTLMQTLSARYNGRTFRRITSSVPAIGANWIVTSPKFVPYYVEQVRLAHLRWGAGDSLTVGHVDGLDLSLWSDQTHPSQAGNVCFARHFYRAFMATLDAAAYGAGDSGPYLNGAAARLAGDNRIYLNVVQLGGTAMTCAGGTNGAATQFQVFKSGSTAASSQFAVQGADLSNSGMIVLTLASTPPDSQALDVWYRLPPDSAAALLSVNQIYDNNLSGYPVDNLTVGRQLSMRPTSVSVPSPQRSRPLLVAPGVLLNTGEMTAVLTSS